MNEIKKVEWKQTTVYKWELPMYLTSMNFQLGKFHLIDDPADSQQVMIIYVSKEEEIE